jgi:hypothetical protein
LLLLLHRFDADKYSQLGSSCILNTEKSQHRSETGKWIRKRKWKNK